MTGAYDGEDAYVVFLTSNKRKYLQVRCLAFDLVKASDAVEAVQRAFPEGSPILSSKIAGHAIAIRIAEPRDQVMVPLEVDKPRWGEPERFNG